MFVYLYAIKVRQKSWVTREVFGEWFHEEFVASVKKCIKANNFPVKALLLLDNTPGHPNADLKSRDGMIQAMFLPHNKCL